MIDRIGTRIDGDTLIDGGYSTSFKSLSSHPACLLFDANNVPLNRGIEQQRTLAVDK